MKKIIDYADEHELAINEMRISIVLNRYNIDERDSLLKYISKYPNVRYIQVCRISTDTRKE